MTDFEVVNQIGKGSISVVYLVKRKTDNQPFAMKCIKKELILDDNLFTSTKLEKDILTRV
jgi:serine/threonine protein kinase